MFKKFEVDNAVEFVNLAEIKGVRAYAGTVAARMDGGYVKLYEGNDAQKFAAELVKEIENCTGENSSIVTEDEKHVVPDNVAALYIDSDNPYEVNAVYPGSCTIYNFKNYADARSFLEKAAAYARLTMVDCNTYVNKKAVDGVSVERNKYGNFVVKISVTGIEFTVACEGYANDAFDYADKLKKLLDV